MTSCLSTAEFPMQFVPPRIFSKSNCEAFGSMSANVDKYRLPYCPCSRAEGNKTTHQSNGLHHAMPNGVKFIISSGSIDRSPGCLLVARIEKSTHLVWRHSISGVDIKVRLLPKQKTTSTATDFTASAGNQ